MYFVGYKDNDKVQPLCTILPKMNGYISFLIKDDKLFEKYKYIFLIKGGKLLEKYNKIWVKVCNSIKKAFDYEPVYNEKHLKTKAKYHEDKFSTNFHDDGILKEGSHCIFLLVRLIDFLFKIGKSHYPQVFLEECKYIVKEKKISN